MPEMVCSGTQIACVEGAGTAVGRALVGHARTLGIKHTDGRQLQAGQITDNQAGTCTVIHSGFTGGLLIEGVRYRKVPLVQGGADIAAKHKGHLGTGRIIEGIADKGCHRRLDVGIANGLPILVLDVIVSRGN